MGRITTAKEQSDIYRIYRKIPKESPIEPIDSIDRYSAADLEAINKSSSQRRVANWVEKMLTKFGHDESIFFYRKAAWRLSDNDIACLMEDSEKPWVKDPHRYFIFLANKKMKR